MGEVIFELPYGPEMEQPARVHVDIARHDILLVPPSNTTREWDRLPVLWARGDNTGWWMPGADRTVAVLTSETSPEVTFDLDWGGTTARGVHVPGDERVVFAAADTGVLVLACSERANHLVTVWRVNPGDVRHVAADFRVQGTTRISLPAGVYTLGIDTAQLPGKLRILEDHTLTVQLEDLLRTATLDVLIASDELGTTPAELRLMVPMRGRLTTTDMVVAARDGHAAFPSLPPGKYLLVVTHPTWGTAQREVALLPGERRVLHIENPQTRRRLRLRFVDADGHGIPTLEFRCRHLPKGAMPLISGVSDANGEATIETAQCDRLAISHGSAGWIVPVEGEDVIELRLEGKRRWFVRFAGPLGRRVRRIGLAFKGNVTSMGRGEPVGEDVFACRSFGGKPALVLAQLDDGVFGILADLDAVSDTIMCDALHSCRVTFSAASDDTPLSVPKPLSITLEVVQAGGLNLTGVQWSSVLFGETFALESTVTVTGSGVVLVRATGLNAAGVPTWQSASTAADFRSRRIEIMLRPIGRE